MWAGGRLLGLVGCICLAGCLSTVVDRDAHPTDPLVPPAYAARADIVDPVIVGDRLLAAGEADLALDTYIRAAAQGGVTPDLQLAMANANIELGRLHQAERLLREVIAARPRDARAINNLGVVLLDLGRIGEAHRLFRTAFALQPSGEIRDNLRILAAKFDDPAYAEPTPSAFTLTRREDGTFGLHAAMSP